MGGSDVNAAFLVNGSLSGGLQSVQQQNFFDQLDQEQTTVKKQKKAESRPGTGSQARQEGGQESQEEEVRRPTPWPVSAPPNRKTRFAATSFTLSATPRFDAKPYSLSGQPFEQTRLHTEPHRRGRRRSAARASADHFLPQFHDGAQRRAVRQFRYRAHAEQRAAIFPSPPPPVRWFSTIPSATSRCTATSFPPVASIRSPRRCSATFRAEPARRRAELPDHHRRPAQYHRLLREAQPHAQRQEPLEPQLRPAEPQRAARRNSSDFRTTWTAWAGNRDVGWSHNFGPRTINSLPLGLQPEPFELRARSLPSAPMWRPPSAFRARRRIR